MPEVDPVDHERCPVCASSKRRSSSNFAPSYYECANCKALVRKNLLAADDYSQGYYVPQQTAFVRVANFLLSRPSLAWKKSLIKRLTQNSGSVFDVGCGDAAFLRSLPQSLRRVGYEPNNRISVKGIEIVEDLEQPPVTFDVITMWHVLEHLEDPRKVTASALSSLKPNGSLIIALPNPRGFGASISPRTWFHLDSAHHKIHYPLASLSRLFGDDYVISKTGFAWECPLDLPRTLGSRGGFFAPLAFIGGLALKMIGAAVGRPETYVAVVTRRPIA